MSHNYGKLMVLGAPNGKLMLLNVQIGVLTNVG